jgi:WD40 repeat protein
VEIAYEGHTNKVSCIDFSGHHLITGSWDQTIRYPTPHTHTHTHTTAHAVTKCGVWRVSCCVAHVVCRVVPECGMLTRACA